MSSIPARKRLGPFLMIAVLMLGAACSRQPVDSAMAQRGGDIVVGMPEGVDLDRRSLALREVRTLQNQGKRVWCVPFARNASGIEIRGDAHSWWSNAKGVYARGKTPQPGAVMAFAPTRGMKLGHVAVVSEIVSDREVRIDHANWERNKVSLGMSVIDISAKGDWSSVRVESTAGAYGKPYPVNGFIYPVRANG